VSMVAEPMGMMTPSTEMTYYLIEEHILNV
jgi:hypothetical protein